MMLEFTEMVPLRSYQHVAEQIEEAICSGELKQGDRLPSELKLKDMFNTSRGSIREALRVLEQKGLIVVRTGVKGGPVVRGVNTEAMRESIGTLIRHQKVSLRHLAEFREFLEGYAAEKAATSENDEQREELSRILNEIRELVERKPQDLEDFHRLDALFHRQVAKMAANPLLEANLVTIHSNIQGYFQKYLSFSEKLLQEDYEDLVSIGSAILKNDCEKAGCAARRHVARFNALMQTAEQLLDNGKEL